MDHTCFWGSITIAPYTYSCIIYRGSFFKNMKTLVIQWVCFLFFQIFYVGEVASIQIWLLYKYEFKKKKPSYTFWLIT
jgi:hypothetical protein